MTKQKFISVRMYAQYAKQYADHLREQITELHKQLLDLQQQEQEISRFLENSTPVKELEQTKLFTPVEPPIVLLNEAPAAPKKKHTWKLDERRKGVQKEVLAIVTQAKKPLTSKEVNDLFLKSRSIVVRKKGWSKSHSSIAAALKTILDNGYVERVKENGIYIYSPTHSR